MSTYLVTKGGENHCYIEADSDQLAVSAVHKVLHGRHIKLWDGNRLVTVMEQVGVDPVQEPEPAAARG
jgi:hypothetical protein